MIQVLKNAVLESEKNRAHQSVGDADDFFERNQENFDLVIFSAVLHHLFDYEMVLKKACQGLKTGTKIIIFFEPLKQPLASSFRYALHRSLSWIDEKSYRLEMKMRNIPLLEDEYHHSDYQRQFGGIDPRGIEKVLKGENCSILNTDKYCARRFGINAWLANRILKTQNTFNILAVRN